MTDIAMADTRDRVMAGILLTSVGYFLFTLHDAVVKLLVVGFAVSQVLFFRSLVIILCCTAVGGGTTLLREAARSKAMGPMLLRSVLLLTAWFCYYTASRDLQLAELTTIYFAAPLLITGLSIVILKEVVPPLRWVAVALGFVGVFIACDPVNLGLSLPVLLVLAAAFCWGLAMVLLRKIALHEKTTVQIILSNCFSLLFAGVPMVFFWQTPSLQEWVGLAVIGLLGGAGQFMLFEGMKRAPASVVAPFEYTALVWAFALGWLIWGDQPRPEVYWGAALIIGAGLIVVAAERLRNPRSL